MHCFFSPFKGSFLEAFVCVNVLTTIVKHKRTSSTFGTVASGHVTPSVTDKTAFDVNLVIAWQMDITSGQVLCCIFHNLRLLAKYSSGLNDHYDKRIWFVQVERCALVKSTVKTCAPRNPQASYTHKLENWPLLCRNLFFPDLSLWKATFHGGIGYSQWYMISECD